MKFEFNAFPACDLQYSIVSIFPNAFTTIRTPQKEVIISSFDLKDKGIHEMKLRAAPSTEMPAIGVISEVKFTVEMIDLCETTSFVD